MSKREMLSLMIKLVGVYCLLQFVPGVLQGITIVVAGAVQSYDQSRIPALGIFVMMIFPLLWLGLCIWVIRQSDRLAARLYPVDAPASQLTTLGIKDIQKLGYHFIGLTLIIKEIPAIVMAVYYILKAHGDTSRLLYYYTQWISPTIQLVIGLVLFLSPQSIANLWAKIRGQQFADTP